MLLNILFLAIRKPTKENKTTGRNTNEVFACLSLRNHSVHASALIVGADIIRPCVEELRNEKGFTK